MKQSFYFVVTGVGALGFVVAACLPAKTAVDAFNLGKCILDHDSETPAQIADDCGKVEVALVVDFLAHERAAFERRQSREAAAAKVDGGK